jgi:hypothetical protein
MGVSAMAGIFISYRRKDTAYQAGAIYDRLVQHFGAQVFKDVDSIPFGDNFVRVIGEFVERSTVVLVLIGDAWLAADPGTGRPRLADPSDFVRREIELALRGRKVVVPLLLGQGQMPEADLLPESIRALTSRNGVRIHPHPHFHQDMEALIRSLEQHVQPTPDRANPPVERGPSAAIAAAPANARPAPRAAPAALPREKPSPSAHRVGISTLPMKAKGGSEATKRGPAGWSWRWLPLAGVGVLLVALMGMGAGGVFKTKAQDGTVVLENLPGDAAVTVDGQAAMLSSGDGKSFEVRVEPRRKHRLEVKKEGFKVFWEEVEVGAGGRKSVVVRLEQEGRPTPPKPAAEDREKWVSLFNGKDLTGWTVNPGHRIQAAVQASDIVLFSKGRLYTSRNDYKNFRLQARVFLEAGAVGSLQFQTVDMRSDGKDKCYAVFLHANPGEELAPGSVWASPGGTEPDRLLHKAKGSALEPACWHSLEVQVTGWQFTVSIDGKVVAETTDDQREYAQGAFALQRRDRVEKQLRFRLIQVQELPATKTGGQEQEEKKKAAAEKKQPEPPPSPPGGQPSTVVIRKGMFWKGVKTWTRGVRPPGTRQEISLEITEVNGNQFRGTFRFQTGQRPVKGSVNGAVIEWGGDGVPSEEFKAKIEGKKMMGDCGNGTFELFETAK